MDLFQGTQEGIRNSRGKRAISIRAIEVLPYLTFYTKPHFFIYFQYLYHHTIPMYLFRTYTIVHRALPITANGTTNNESRLKTKKNSDKSRDQRGQLFQQTTTRLFQIMSKIDRKLERLKTITVIKTNPTRRISLVEQSEMGKGRGRTRMLTSILHDRKPVSVLFVVQKHQINRFV